MPTEPETDRAVRLLTAMHPVLSHDLPNQLVTLQGLLQLLEAEGVLPEGSDGHEYLRRLLRVAQKANDQVRILRDLVRLSPGRRRLETVTAADLLRDLQFELHKEFSPGRLEIQIDDAFPSIVADVRLLGQAIVQIVRVLTEHAAPGRCSLNLAQRPLGKDHELRGSIAYENDSRKVRAESAPFEQRLEIVLAQEMLAAWGAKVGQVREEAGRGEFTLLLPQELSRG
jgi:hypothetical protein